MFPLQMVKRVVICHMRVDFRKAHNGLMASAIIAGLDPNEGDLVVFVGRRCDRIKILFRDSNGCLMVYKLFDSLHLRHFKFLNEPSSRVVTAGEVALLLEGHSGMLKVPPKKTED